MAVALITGVSSDIGLATAVTLARAGHTVIATMRNLDAADAARKAKIPLPRNRGQAALYRSAREWRGSELRALVR
jgi:NAD(P)-dependent dehydrogenase (short-subunit alcohol dehydrogenase family)